MFLRSSVLHTSLGRFLQESMDLASENRKRVMNSDAEEEIIVIPISDGAHGEHAVEDGLGGCFK